MRAWKKRAVKVISLMCALLFVALTLVGCDRAPGIYNWYGGKMDADTILRLTIDMGDGEKSYEVSFEEYRAVFLYLKGIVSTEAPIEGAEVENGIIPTKLTTAKEQTVAIKEVAEGILTEYYSMVALGESLGITITEADHEAFRRDYENTIQSYIRSIRENGVKYDGTIEEYAESLYVKSLALARMTPEYFEFSYYRDLLEKRIKMAISTDLADYLAQSYFHYKQVVVIYTKGDSVAESEARAKITAAKAALDGGAEIDEVIKTYSNYDYSTEIYFDVYGNIIGSTSNDTVNAIAASAVRAIRPGEISDVISGDDSTTDGYFAILCRLPVEVEYACGNSQVGRLLYQYPYGGAGTYSTYYARYQLLLSSRKQNMICEPVDGKVYKRIAVNTLY